MRRYLYYGRDSRVKVALRTRDTRSIRRGYVGTPYRVGEPVADDVAPDRSDDATDSRAIRPAGVIGGEREVLTQQWGVGLPPPAHQITSVRLAANTMVTIRGETMGRRRRQSSLSEVLLDAPWWVSVVLAVGSYVVFHTVERESKGSVFWGCRNYAKGCRVKLARAA